MKTKPIIWDKRYSETMEDDEQGRWARIATISNIYDNGKLAYFQIAWISKLAYDHKDGYSVSGFSVRTFFPSPAIKPMYDTVEEAMTAVEKAFVFFIENVTE